VIKNWKISPNDLVIGQIMSVGTLQEEGHWNSKNLRSGHVGLFEEANLRYIVWTFCDVTFHFCGLWRKMYLIILRSKLKINKSFSPINWSHCCLLDAFYKGTKRTCKRYLWSWWCTQWIVLLLQNLLCSTMNLSVTCNQVEQV